MSEKRKDNKGRILRNGEVQRRDGKYMFRYTDSNGQRRTIYSWKLVNTDKVPDGKRCSESLRDMERDIQRDIEDSIRTNDARSITVNDAFSSFINLRTDLRTTTRCDYICLYNKHVKNVIGKTKIKNVKFSDIQKLYMCMVQDENLKASTVQSVHSFIYQIFNSAVLDNIIRTNPASGALKSLKKILSTEPEKRHALTESEQRELVDYVYNTKQFRRWAPLITVLLGTGMRVGEALGLRWCDCDFENNTINVTHALLYKTNEAGKYEYRISLPKTASGMRVIPMFSEVKSALLAQKEMNMSIDAPPFSVGEYTDFIFLNNNGKVFTHATVFDAIQNIVVTHNKEEYFNAKEESRDPVYLPKFSAHILRHTFCTRMCENEPNIKIVQDVMGHKNIRTTMDVYNEATMEKKRASFEHLEGVMKLS